MRIDAHVHITPDGSWFGSKVDASLSRLLKEMDQAGLDRAVVIALPGAAGNADINEMCAAHPDRLWAMGNLDLNSPETLTDQLRWIKDQPAMVGLKVHPRLQNIAPLDQRLAEPLDLAGRLGLPVMLCTNYGHGPLPLETMRPAVFDTLAKRHPDTTFILAHACVHRPLDAFYIAKSNPNVFLDMSMTLNYLRGTSAFGDLLFVCEHLDRKVLFGTDFPEVGIPGYLALLEQQRGTRDADIDMDAVCGGNLLGILGRNG